MSADTKRAARNAVQTMRQFVYVDSAGVRRFGHHAFLAHMEARNDGKPLPDKIQRLLAQCVDIFCKSEGVQS